MREKLTVPKIIFENSLVDIASTSL